MELFVIILILVIGIFLYTKKRKNMASKNVAKKDSSEGTNTKKITADLSNRFLRINEINFFGVANKSENNKYIVACQDSDYRGGTRGGARDSGNGRAVLIKNNQLLWVRDFQRPHDAVVSNDGFVALNDWLFGDGLKGKFFIINPSGEVLIADQFTANLHKLGISNDSKLAWTTTLVSDTSDSTQLIVYDPINGKKLFQRDSLYGEVQKCKFINEHIEFTTEQDIFYRFSPDGNLLNESEVEEEIENKRLNSNNHWDVLSIVAEKIDELDESKVEEDKILDLISTLENLDSKNVDNYSLAKVHRYLGELKLMLNKKSDALSHFETALGHNDKVGVKRMVSSLKKELE